MIGGQRQNVSNPGKPDQDIVLQRHRGRRSIRKRLIGLYVCAAVMTLIFQIYVRSNACAAVEDCRVSYAKAIVWSVIWPASWVAYLKGTV